MLGHVFNNVELLSMKALCQIMIDLKLFEWASIPVKMMVSLGQKFHV